MKRKGFIWKSCISLFLVVESAGFILLAKGSFIHASLQNITFNTPPKVEITQPTGNDAFEWNTLVRYSIRVSDKEDGESNFQEIEPKEVMLQVIYFNAKAQADEYIQNGSLSAPDSPGLALIRTSDCFGCHSIKDKLTGPPFAEIAKRYPNNSATKTLLAGRIINGNTGVWGVAAMPPHPDFTNEQAQQIVQWILENTQDTNRDYYVGTEGTFRTRTEPVNEVKGVYLLSASYTDHGTEPASQGLRGQHTILLLPKQ